MDMQLTFQERGLRGVLALLLAVVVYRSGFSGDALTTVTTLGALAIGLAAAGTALLGRSTGVMGLEQDHALAFLTARLYVGWEFTHAGWEKLTGEGWVGGSAGTGIKGFLGNVISAPMTTGEHPAVPMWFADLTRHVFLPHAEIMSYAIVFGELAVGLGLIVGLFTRTAAFFAVTLNLAFLFGGSTSAGTNPQMLVAGLLVLTGTAAIYALSIDRIKPHLGLDANDETRASRGRPHVKVERAPAA